MPCVVSSPTVVLKQMQSCFGANSCPLEADGELIGVAVDRVFAADVAAFGGENFCCDSPELFGVEVAERVNEFAGDRVGVAGLVAFGVAACCV